MAQSPLVPCRRWPLSEAGYKPHLIPAGEATSSGARGLPASHHRESDPEWMAGGQILISSAILQELAVKSVSVKVVQLQMRSPLRFTGEDLHPVSLDWWIRLNSK